MLSSTWACHQPNSCQRMDGGASDTAACSHWSSNAPLWCSIRPWSWLLVFWRGRCRLLLGWLAPILSRFADSCFGCCSTGHPEHEAADRKARCRHRGRGRPPRAAPRSGRSMLDRPPRSRFRRSPFAVLGCRLTSITLEPSFFRSSSFSCVQATWSVKHCRLCYGPAKHPLTACPHLLLLRPLVCDLAEGVCSSSPDVFSIAVAGERSLDKHLVIRTVDQAAGCLIDIVIALLQHGHNVLLARPCRQPCRHCRRSILNRDAR